MLSFAGNLIAGVDEAGRGPLVGPVVAAAVVFKPEDWDVHSGKFIETLDELNSLNDSKKLSKKKRELLYDKIHTHALSVGVGFASAAEIDDINILQATFLAMARAIRNLTIKPSEVWVDGNQLPKIQQWPYRSHAFIGGDAKILEISAASIVAKVARDRWMDELGRQHPGYGFSTHSGYPTKAHLEAIARLGIIPEHRRSYGPVKNLIASAVE
jgi:ribonuclease HII